MRLTTVERNGFKFSFCNREEFEKIYHDTFISGDLEFHCEHDSPFIVDAGAHIGLASLHFKQLYPQARILALEPNPTTFAILERNIRQNLLDNVQLVQAAVAATAGRVPFNISRDTEMPWTWGDSVIRNAWYSEKATQEISVPAVSLSSLLSRPVDLLKLDIEGLETTVLAEAASHLNVVRQIIVEFHGSSTNPTNSPERVLSMFRQAGLAYTVQQHGRIIDERRIRKDDPYWLIIRARRLSDGRVARFLGSRPRLYCLRAQLLAIQKEVRKVIV